MIRFCWRGIYVEAEFGFFVLSALIGLLYGTYFFLLFLIFTNFILNIYRFFCVIILARKHKIIIYKISTNQ